MGPPVISTGGLNGFWAPGRWLSPERARLRAPGRLDPGGALPAAMAGHDAGHGRERAAADATVGGGSWGEDAAGSHGERRRALEAVG